MKKMYKSRNEENLLPFHIIKAASEGDVSAINAVLKHYEGYIIKLSTRKLYVLLSQTERITMNGRPAEPKYARNKNVLVVGGSGSGKTRFFIKPNLLQMHSSYVVTDPKG